jgi:2,3-bisphosphoglycerate-dependent phosphoglycerate mutase
MREGTRFCVVRHGETAWNAEGRVQGQLDVPLSQAGVGQARAVARALSQERFDALYSSDLVRVRQTAAPSARRLGLAVSCDAALRERHYGVFQGMTYAEARTRLPADYARFRSKELDFDFGGGGESLSAFSARVLAYFEALCERHCGESLLVFTHGGVLEMLYRHATARGLSTPRDFEIPNAALNRLERGAGRWEVIRWADLAHIEVALDDLPD